MDVNQPLLMTLKVCKYDPDYETRRLWFNLLDSVHRLSGRPKLSMWEGGVYSGNSRSKWIKHKVRHSSVSRR